MIDRFRVLFLSRSFSVSATSQAKAKKMPPKKAAAQEKKVMLGRPSNNLKIGIVGAFALPFHAHRKIHADHSRASKRRKVVLLQCTLEHRFVLVQPVLATHSTHADLGKAANFPYATINPEEARIPVPDVRFEWLCDLYKPASRVPAFLTCIDIAGLTAVRTPVDFPSSHLNQD